MTRKSVELARKQAAAAKADAKRWNRLAEDAEAGKVDLEALAEAEGPEDDDDDDDDAQEESTAKPRSRGKRNKPGDSKAWQWAAAAAIAGGVLWLSQRGQKP